MDYFQNKVNEAEKYKAEAENSLATYDVRCAKVMIDKLGRICKNLDYYKLLIQYVKTLDAVDLLGVLDEALLKFPFNAALNLALCDLLEERGEYDACLRKYYELCRMCFAKIGKEYLETVSEKVRKALERIPTEALGEKEKAYAKALSEYNGENADLCFSDFKESIKPGVGSIFREGTGDESFISLYGTALAKQHAFGILPAISAKAEMIKGKKAVDSYSFHDETPSVVTLSFIGSDNDFGLNVNIDGEEHDFVSLNADAERFYHFRIPAGSRLELKHQGDFFVGEPITLQPKPGLKKLVLYIFVDALSGKFLQDIGLEENMPNTHKYFKGGFISGNCFANNEWTLTSMQTMFTGKYSTNHKKYHPYRVYDYSKFSRQMAEYFSEKGYFTNFIGALPTELGDISRGVYKGFDRMIFRQYGFYKSFEVLFDTIENIEAFAETNQFVFINLSDLHDANDGGFRELYASAAIELETRLNVKVEGKESVFQSYDPARIEIYKKYIRELDVMVGILFDYLNKKYSDEEITVLMTSDHGQAFISNEGIISPNARGLVTLFIKDTAINSIQSDEIIQLTDVLPILGKICSFSVDEEIDGRLPKVFGGKSAREFSYTECVYPGQIYQASLANDTHYLYFISEGLADHDGLFRPGNFKYVYKNRLTENDETAMYPEQVEFLLKAVFEHIKDYMLL